jgi:hypothetical protein
MHHGQVVEEQEERASHMFASTAEIGPVNCLVPQANVPVVIVRVVAPVVPPAIRQPVADGGVIEDDETSGSLVRGNQSSTISTTHHSTTFKAC